MRKIGIIILFLILLPLVFYTVYQLSNLNNTEKMVEASYRQQLNSMLFSVNQYCWDVVSSWSARINLAYMETGVENFDNSLNQLLTENHSIQAILFSDSTFHKVGIFNQTGEGNLASLNEDLLQAYFKSRPEESERLIRYKKAGYRKIEPMILPQNAGFESDLISFLFKLDQNINKPDLQFAGIILNVPGFITDILLPKTNDMEQRFALSIIYKSQIFEADTSSSVEEEKNAVKEAVWLLPDTYLQIRLRGETIQDLARRRVNQNLVLIGLLDFIVIFAGWFLYRNIKKEMELAEMKSSFVSNVSHELRTPLSLIRMFAETLELNRVRTEEKKNEYYKIIGQETERLTHLINNILNFSKMEAGRKEYHFQKFDLIQMINTVLDSYQFHLENNGFKLEKSFPENQLLLNGDREALSEAFINLLDNAVKYSENDKTININAGSTNGTLFFEIKDHGIGISQEDQKKIFDKFYRVSHGLVHNKKGTGLGLTLVKKIVEAHKGKIIVESQLGNGSLFRVVLPQNSDET
jgi:two-component system, OmpR family, phosphate regulon sensor histidine kinase PhoR